MDAELKAKWVSALRSGKFRQSHDSIGEVGAKRLCCLGVGAIACKPRTKRLVTTDDALDILHREGGFVSYTDHTKGCYSQIAQKLINMNDRDRKSFKQIADYIEKHL